MAVSSSPTKDETYTEPIYLNAGPANSVLADSTTLSSLRLSSQAILSLNYLSDELLHLFVHSSLSPSSSKSNSLLAPGEVVTIDRIKGGILKVMGSSPLSKSAVLEAELAVRELLRLSPPSLHGDASLRKGSFASGAGSAPNGAIGAGAEKERLQQADEIFRGLRAYVQEISVLGSGAQSRGSLAGRKDLGVHLASLTPPPTAPHPSSNHIRFLTALYTERAIMTIVIYVLEAIGRVMEREESVSRNINEEAGLQEFAEACQEDQAIWSWYKSLRVKAYVVTELENLNRNGSKNMMSIGRNSKESRMSVGNGRASGLTRAVSVDSTRSGKGLSYGSSLPSNPADDADSVNEFEHLMLSGETKQLSLTPNRLKTMDRSERSRQSSAENASFSRSLSSSISMPVLNAPPASSAMAPSFPSSGLSTQRLQARAARATDQIEEDEDDEDLGYGAKRKPKESLLELLKSTPPWPEQPSKISIPANGQRSAPATPAGPSFYRPRKLSTSRRKPSLTKSGTVLTGEDEREVLSPTPLSSAMQPSPSDQSMKSYSGLSSLSKASIAETELSTNSTPMNFKTRRALMARVEAVDPLQARKVNSDLVDFFSAGPPSSPPAPLYDPFVRDDELAGTSSKKKGGIRGFMSSMGRRSSRPKEDVSVASPNSSPESARGQYTTPPTTPGKIAKSFAGTGSLNTPSSATPYSTPPSSIKPSLSGRSQLAPITPSPSTHMKTIEIVANAVTPYTPTPAVSSRNLGISRPPITAYTFTSSASAPPIPPIPEEHSTSPKRNSPVAAESFATAAPIIQLVRKSSLSSSSITPSFATAQEELGLRSRRSGSASSEVPSPLPSPQPQLLFRKEAETARINGTSSSGTSYVGPPPSESASKHALAPNSALSALSNANYVHPSPSYIKRENSPTHSNSTSTATTASIVGGIGLIGGVIVGRGLSRSSSARVKVPAAFPLSSPTISTPPSNEDIKEEEVRAVHPPSLTPALVESDETTEVPEQTLEVAPSHTELPESISKDVILTDDLPEDDRSTHSETVKKPSVEEETTTPLLELRKKMASAKSVEECLALLDGHITAQASVTPPKLQKEGVDVHSGAQEELLAGRELDEEALMAEFFLCGDLPLYSPVRAEEIVEGEQAGKEETPRTVEEAEQEEGTTELNSERKEASTTTTFADVDFVHQSLATPDPEEQTWPQTPTSP